MTPGITVDAVRAALDAKDWRADGLSPPMRWVALPGADDMTVYELQWAGTPRRFKLAWSRPCERPWRIGEDFETLDDAVARAQALIAEGLA